MRDEMVLEAMKMMMMMMIGIYYGIFEQKRRKGMVVMLTIQ